jgi:hypothetical protein
MRSEGSLTKAPTVVNRPVPSISRRSMIRTGEVVVVPTGWRRRRCGMSEPVTKTVTSFGCSRRTVISLTGLPPSSVPPNVVMARRTIALGDNFVFTSNTTPAIVLCKFSSRPSSIRSAAPDRGAKAPRAFHPPLARLQWRLRSIAATPLPREPGYVTTTRPEIASNSRDLELLR